MAGAILIPNQSIAVARELTGYCPDDPAYCQPVTDTQLTTAQFATQPLTNVQLLTDPNFQSTSAWGSPSGMVPQAQGAIVTASGSDQVLTQNLSAPASFQYRLYRVVLRFRIDQLDGNAQFQIWSNTFGATFFYLENMQDLAIGVEYTVTRYFYSDLNPSPRQLNITIEAPASGSAVVYLRDISMVIMQEPEFTLKDCDGNTVQVIPDYETYIKGGMTDTTFVDIPFRTGNNGHFGNLVVNIDWSQFDDGCYQLCWTDGEVETCSECLEKGCALPLITLQYSDNQPAFGFEYSTLPANPQQEITFIAVLDQATYPDVINDDYLFSNGQRISTFVHTRKIYKLLTGRMPEYMHDAIRVALLHQNILIDGIRYKKIAGDYSPNWSNDSLLASVEVEIEVETQNTYGQYS